MRRPCPTLPRPPLPAASLATTSPLRSLLHSMARGTTAALAIVAAATVSTATAAFAASSGGNYRPPPCLVVQQQQQQQQQQQRGGWSGKWHHDQRGGRGGGLLCWATPPLPSAVRRRARQQQQQQQQWRGIMTGVRAASGGGEGGSGRLWRREGALLVTSAENGKVKKMKALGKKKKERERESVVLLEGHRLLLDAVEAGHAPLQVLVCPEAFDAPRGPQLQALLESLPAAAVTLCTAPLVAAACDTVSPQGVVAVIPRPETPASSSSPSPSTQAAPLCLVMDGMQDPGNVGTLIRTAVACGVSEVMVVQGCDPWSPKALRSGMGATFKAPRVSEAGSWEEAKAALAGRHKGTLQFVAADGGEGVEDYDAIDWTGPSVLVVGNEGSGLSDAVRAELAAGGIKGGRIPLAGEIESLNAGAAGAIILAEAARQRRRHAGK